MLHVGSPDGPPVCHIKSAYLGPPMIEAPHPGPISITIGLKRHVVEVHRGKASASDRTYSFRGLDDKEYRWQPSSWLWGGTLEVRTINGYIREDG